MKLTQSNHPPASLFIEDFEDGNQPGFDSMFNHQIEPLAELDVIYWDITDTPWGNDYTEAMGYTLGIAPAKNIITFNLQPTQQVGYASVDMVDYGDGAVRFIGSEGEFTYTQDQFTNEWVTFSTENLDIGWINSIELFAIEAVYDNITIEVVAEEEPVTPSATVPEPGMALVLGVAVLSLGAIRIRQALG
ncbi:MAG: hypothetical protein AAFQ89_17480 [Cyanobacteria bacterium J06626_18]